MARNIQSMKIKKIIDLAPGIKQITLIGQEAFNFIPGQFVTIHLPHPAKKDNFIRRSYSIASQNNENEIDFAISYVTDGFASDVLFNASIHDEFNVSGPAGRLVLEDNHPQRYVLIATGTGITPYIAMLPQIENITVNQNIKFDILFGARSLEYGIYYDKLTKFSQNNKLVNTYICLSREMPINPENNILQGYVQNHLSKLSLNPEQDKIYLCGNPNMIDAAFAALKELNFNARNVRREKYISSKDVVN